jgi:hypothetical protein
LFTKGESKNFKYKNLSGGEKAAFDLLLDFVLKTKEFDDTVFCIDEPELHIHTKLQAKLLDEMYRILPPKCQLWVATHSIGMLRRAMDMWHTHLQEVVFLDFGDQNFDHPVVISPSKVDRQFWRKMFSVALDDLADLVAPTEIIFCEGKEEKGRKRDTTFDAEIYRRIFQIKHPGTEFIPLGNDTGVQRDSKWLASIFERIVPKVKMWRLLDRDDRSDDELNELQTKGTRVLKKRDIENYLWDNEILEKLCQSGDQADKLAEVIATKEKLISQAQSNNDPPPIDDIKAISGLLYVEVRKLLKLTQKGNTVDEFSRVTLASLITPDTLVYKELEQIIFGENPR